MNKTLLMILGLAMAPMMALAQPDFSGTWVADTARSEPAIDTNYWFGRIDGPEVGQPDLRVEQEGNRLSVFEESRVLTRYALPAVYVADGQPHQVTDSSTGLAQVTITTNWEDNKLVINMVKPWGSMPGNISLETQETWMLSPDGGTLYITTKHNSPAKAVAYTRVYNRQ